MSRRTNYSSQTRFTRPSPASVIYDLSIPHQATITLPPNSTWTSGPHWHETHTEYLQVISGSAEITLSGTILPAVTKDDGVVTVPRGAVHEWRRSQSSPGGRNLGEDEDLVVREWTDPKDGGKEVFFRNLNGMILDFVEDRKQHGNSQKSWLGKSWDEWMLEVDLMSLFWKCDNWPVFLSQSWWPGWAQAAVTKVVLGLSITVGLCTGKAGIYREYGVVSS